jgi:hypothetical protein
MVNTGKCTDCPDNREQADCERCVKAGKAPCNIPAVIQQLYDKIADLETRVDELEG